MSYSKRRTWTPGPPTRKRARPPWQKHDSPPARPRPPDPVEHYARLMLGRTLQRQARHEEAEPHLRLASALAGDFPED
ncbi:hypothetical protein ABZ372_39165 [Streptomyces sp. NPDC005921]